MRNSLRCDASRDSWEWVLATSVLTQLCIVTDSSLPDQAIQALAKHFSGVPQLALLHIADPLALHRKWIASHRYDVSNRAVQPGDHASVPVKDVSRAVHLLVWSHAPEALDWIGGVQGHATSHIRYDGDEDEASVARLAIEQIYPVFRGVIQRNLNMSM